MSPTKWQQRLTDERPARHRRALFIRSTVSRSVTVSLAALRSRGHHDGTVFRRGPDVIPRGTAVALLRALWDDDGNLAQELFARNGADLDARSAFARGLLRAANGAYGPMAMLAAFREFADRLDGRPKQATETRQQRVTIMYRRGDPPPWLPKEMLPRGGQAAATAVVTAPTEPPRQPDLVPMEGPPEGPFSR